MWMRLPTLRWRKTSVLMPRSIRMVTVELEKEGIETEIVHVGNKVIRGCTACGQCYKNRNEQCVQPGDEVNEWVRKMRDANGIILGSPVHYAGMAVYKIGILLFNLVPYLALLLMARGSCH